VAVGRALAASGHYHESNPGRETRSTASPIDAVRSFASATGDEQYQGQQDDGEQQAEDDEEDERRVS